MVKIIIFYVSQKETIIMKNKYIIMIYDLCIDILKKEDDKLLLIKENIQSKLSYDNTLSNQIILDDFATTI